MLCYDLPRIADLAVMLRDHGDWMLLGRKVEKQETEEGTIEHWAHCNDNPIGGCYGLKKNFRGRFAIYIPPLMEHLSTVELERNAPGSRIRAR